MTTPNPSRSVSPEPTKGEEAVDAARERLYGICTGAGTGLKAEIVMAYEDAIRAAYIPLVEAAEADAETIGRMRRALEALKGDECWCRAVFSHNGERAHAGYCTIARLLLEDPDAHPKALVQVPGQQQADTEQGGG